MYRNIGIKLFLIFVLGIFLVGCSSAKEDAEGKSVENAEEIEQEDQSANEEEPNNEDKDEGKEETTMNKAQMMISNFIISEQGFHEIAEEIEKGNYDQNFLRKVQKAKAAIESIEWTEDVIEEKDLFLKDVTELEKALITKDYESALVPAKAAHETQHEFYKKVNDTVKLISGGDSKAQMMIANYIISKQGVHTIAEELEKGNQDPGFLRKVQAAKAAVESIEWTDDVKEAKDTFYRDVTELEQALIAEDYEAAVTPAKSAHETQHALDKIVASTIKAMTGGDAKAQMMIANYMISDQGVHMIAEELEKGNQDPSFLRKVQKAKAVVESIEWTDAVKDKKDAFYKDVTELEKALIAEDYEAAVTPAKAAHESQHELDKTVNDVIAEMDTTVTGTTKVETEDNQTLEEGTPLKVMDWEFENITLKPGKQVITVTNTGNMVHGIVIPNLGVMSEDIGSGETVNIEVNIEEPGTYNFYCSVPECGTPEQHGGMVGEIIVK
ncbi:cupredoxin domain-containing protein [Bacillaceae bacterium S4-13-58]